MIERHECADTNQLRQLLAGKLSEQDSILIIEHLAECETCQTVAQSLDAADTLVALLRETTAKPTPPLGHQIEQVMSNLRELSVNPTRSAEVAETVLSTFDLGGSSFKDLPHTIEDELAELLEGVRPAENPDELGRLGNFRLLKLLGHGGMGAVVLAEDTELRRKVALKIIRADIASQREGKERFLREARAAANVRHENVVAIYQVGQENGIPFLAQELLEGEPLNKRLEQLKRMSLAETLSIGRQIAAGLAAAHERGLIHRDIKPANVWIERPGDQTSHVKILDFGLARSIGDGDQLTQSGMILGTPAYMAPEQANGDEVDARADLFSLGVVLYRMTTGQLPFQGKKTLEILQSLATVTPPSVRTINPHVPRELSDLIDRLIAKKRIDRPATATEVASQLSSIEKSLSHGRLKKGIGDASGKNRNHWLMAGFAAFFVLLFSMTWVVIKNNKGEVVATVKVPADGSVTVGPSTTSDNASIKPTAALTNEPTIILADPGKELGEWNLPTGSPAPAHEPFSVTEAVAFQKSWAEFLGVPVEIENSIGMKFRLIPPGDFEIGVTDEEIASYCRKTKRDDDWGAMFAKDSPQLRNARLTRALYFGVTEVTISQFKSFVDATRYVTSAELSSEGGLYIRSVNGSGITKRDPRYQWRTPHDQEPDASEPVSQVSIRDMKRFCRWLLEKEGEEYRLPTESEWEFASRAGEPSKGLVTVNPRQVLNIAWLTESPRSKLRKDIPLPCGLLESNGFGLYDCIGNVYETCKVDQPRRHGEAPYDYTKRGGGYVAWSDFVTSAACWPHPSQSEAENASSDSGFRVVREIKLNALGKAIGTPTNNARHKTSVSASPGNGKSEPQRTLLAFERPGFDQWVKHVGELPAEKQVEAVTIRLKELNPSFDGKLTAETISNGVVIELGFATDQVIDISPVRALRDLDRLTVVGTSSGSGFSNYRGKLTDLSPLEGMKLSYLNLSHNPDLKDLSPLRGMPLATLGFCGSQVSDLSPLSGMPLKTLNTAITKVSDLSPLSGMPLSCLACGATGINDLSPLKGMSLVKLICDSTPISSLAPLEGMPLVELNISWTRVVDLGPLTGMPLEEFNCSNGPVSDISPLKGLRLTKLLCTGTRIADFSALEGMRLNQINFTPKNISKGISAIREMTSINSIGTGPYESETFGADEFWKKYDRGEFGAILEK